MHPAVFLLLCPQLIYIPWQAASSSCCCAHLVLCETPGWSVDAKLLQRVDDLPSRADRDRTLQDKIQRVHAGTLSAEEESSVSASSEGESPL